MKLSIPLQARLCRKAIRRLVQSARYTSLSDSPVLFANSFPKSGTHLLIQILKGFSRIGPAVDSGMPAITYFVGESGEVRPVHQILSLLHKLKPGDVSYGHLPALPAFAEVLCSPSFATYFIYRDPRDVVVSHVHYITELAPKHIYHQYYRQALPDFNARLRTSILGIRAEELSQLPYYQTSVHVSLPEQNGFVLPDIRQRFEPYLGWLQRGEVLTLRYEDLIDNPSQIIGHILDHALQRGFKIRLRRDEAIRHLMDNIQPAKSPTFRSGKSGEWRTAFTHEHKALFKEVANDLLLILGYEQTEAW